MKIYTGIRSKPHQLIEEDDIQAVVDVLRSKSLTQGPSVDAFEDEISKACGSKYAVVANSATSILHLVCLAVDLGPGDWLWTVPNTFVATSNCALYCGAKVDFVDISADDFNMDVEALRQKLIQADKTGKLPKVIIPIHFGGQPAKMKEIYELGKKYGCLVFEDASHALGAEYKGESIGKCQYSDGVILSFHPVKIITSAEGGAFVTNTKALADKISLLRSHGITRDENQMTSNSEGAWYYQQIALGYNYRMTDLQAALGISQIKKLKQFISKRNKIADFYDEKFQGSPFRLPKRYADSTSAWHLYVIRLELDKIKISRKDVFNQLWERNIPVNVHYIPVHTQPFYKGLGFKEGDFPNSERHYKEALSLPMHCNLEDSELERVVSGLHEILNF